MWVSPACTSRRRQDPLDRPTWRKRLTNPGRPDFLEVFRKTACSEGLQPNPEYSNTQQGLPDYWCILIRLLNMQGFWLWSSFAEKPLVLDPYFQYFSPNWVISYKLGLPTSLEQTWLNIISYQRDTIISPTSIFLSFPSLVRCDALIKALISASHSESIRFNFARWT